MTDDDKAGDDKAAEATVAVAESGGGESKLLALSRQIESWIALGCARVAVAVTGRPWRTIGVSVGVCVVLSLGWFRIDDEAQVEKLYTPQHTRAFRDRKWVEDHFKDADSPSSLLLNREDGDTNVLERAALEEVFDMYEFVLGIDSEKHSRGYDERSCAKVYWYDEVFEAPPGRSVPHEVCQKSGILAFWDWNRTKFDLDDDLIATINEPAKPDCCDPSSRVVSLPDVAAKFEYDDPADGRESPARAR